eukprot:SAG31_NODE_1598_length_7798_cov_7.682167_1_plen_41_part_00
MLVHILKLLLYCIIAFRLKCTLTKRAHDDGERARQRESHH